MNQYYKYATSSVTNYIKFICHTQYPYMINRAIGAKLVNSSVGEQNLADSLIAAAKVQSLIFNHVMDFELQTSPSFNEEVNSAILQLKARGSRPLKQVATPSYCSETFSGPLTEEQQATCGALAGQNSGWTSDNINTAISALGSIFGSLSNLFGNSSSGSSDNGSAGSGNAAGSGTGTGNGDQTDYMPYVFGGAALLIIIVVAVLLYMKAKK